MPNHDEQRHRSPREVPPVGRPRGATWRALQADGVVWEGQVLLVGDDVDLAARMIVTHRRVVFARGGDLVLDIPRGWLRPEPVLRRDGVLDLFVSMPGSDPFAEPMRVPLRMREGHPAAGHIIAMLAPSGVRRIAPDTLSAMERAREAAPQIAFGGFWDDDLPRQRDARDDLDEPGADGAEQQNGSHAPAAVDARDWAPLEPPDLVVRAPSSPHRQASANTYPITGLQPRDQRKSPWGLILRLSALTLLLATAAALGAGRLDLRLPGAQSQPILAAPTATPPATASPAEPSAAALRSDDLTAVAMGVGGPAATATATGVPAAAASPATDTGEAAAVTAPTEPAIPTPATTATPVTASTPTPAPSPTPPSTATATTTSAPSAATTAAPDDSSLSQAAAVAAAEPPAQEIVAGPIRVALTTALRAESLPKYGLPPGSGEWVVLVAELTNEGDAPASMAMTDFRLFDRGTGVVGDLDTGTDVIARLAGFDPARAAGDTIALEPGDTAEALLLFLLPPGSSEDVALLVGQSSLDLAPSLALGEAAAAPRPELVAAKVSEVLDGGRIVVDVEGSPRTVQYLGFQAPAAGACFAAEATAANAQLLAGGEVWLERQASDRGEDDALWRDVWIEDTDGRRVLVAARLLETGGGELAVAAPDTRYQAWLSASAALGRFNGAGIWGACPQSAASANPSVEAPRLAFLSGDWRQRNR